MLFATNFSGSKLCQCYFVSFFHLCRLYLWSYDLTYFRSVMSFVFTKISRVQCLGVGVMPISQAVTLTDWEGISISVWQKQSKGFKKFVNFLNNFWPVYYLFWWDNFDRYTICLNLVWFCLIRTGMSRKP